ncbi:outer membrane biogenesis protein BamB [Rubripirellula amarantea]|uniref:Outer membrane biogenesis protein BamB n=1 Tax=Rubripirellula amarantea TaxID=2527999 RepID=A0A5C5WR79_9BACT|nr:PQQ-binding-like beta-propeller repeat protein [Rubripirellula amarantea]TWT52679.1 outer membrane biogenesis protein BamB [Rubripirellula amarantea]
MRSVWIVRAYSGLQVLLLLGCGANPSPIHRIDQAATVKIQATSNTPIHSEASSDTKHPANWPALFGADRTSHTSFPLTPTWTSEGPPLIWEVEVGTGYGSPVTADGKVIVNYRDGDEEFVQCHDVETGEQIWQHRYPTAAVCEFEYSDGPYSTPIIDETSGRVFNVGAQGQMQCLELDSGKEMWSRDLHQEYDVDADIFPVGASPILDRDSSHEGGQLIFNLGAISTVAGIVSLDARTGETIWQATDHGPSYATPVVARIHDQRFAFVLTDFGLVCLDPDTGKVDWEFEYRRRGDLTRNATSPLVHGNHVLVVCSGLGALDIEVMPDRSYREHWRDRRSIDSQYNTLILGDDHVYSFTSGGQGGAEFRCVDLTDGKITWKYHSVLKRGMGFATENSIILLGEKGHLASMVKTPQDPEVISFTRSPLMAEPCYCSPAFYGDMLFLKDEQRLAAFRLRE